MSNSNADAAQVLAQVAGPLRDGALRPDEADLFGFQLLVWSHLGLEDEGNDLRTALVHGVPGVIGTLRRIASTSDLHSQAFRDAANSARDAEALLSAATAAQSLTDAGIFERFSPVDIAAELIHRRNHEAGIAPEVARLMVDIVMRGGTIKSVYCPWESTGQLVSVLLEGDATSYVETPYAEPVVALLALARPGRIDISHTNVLIAPKALRGGHLHKFDAAVSIPPMNRPVTEDVASRDLYSRFPIKKATGNGLNVQHILAQTNGRMAILVANSFLFGPGKDRDVRKHLVGEGFVEAVIALPAGVIKQAGIPCAILVLNSTEHCSDIRFVNAARPFFAKTLSRSRTSIENVDVILSFLDGQTVQIAGDAGGDALASIVSANDVLENDSSLQVERYVVPQQQREMQAKLSTVETQPLEDVVDILSPIPHKDRGEDSPTAIRVFEFGAADLPAVGYIRSPGKPVSIKLSIRRSGNADEAFLRPYDVVLIVKGSTGKVGIVPAHVPSPGPGGWIAGQSAVVLRSKRKDVELRGLGLWLRSELGQLLLGSIQSGATIPMVSVATLRRLQVITMSEPWSQLAAAVLDEEEELQDQIDALRYQQGSIAKELWTQLLGSTNDNTGEKAE